jgi:hypothetical protein
MPVMPGAMGITQRYDLTTATWWSTRVRKAWAAALSALSAPRYSKFIVACEFVGVTAVLPYCLMLLRRCQYCGTGSGLPADDGHWKLPADKRFKVRVLIPCYKVRPPPSRPTSSRLACACDNSPDTGLKLDAVTYHKGLALCACCLTCVLRGVMSHAIKPCSS